MGIGPAHRHVVARRKQLARGHQHVLKGAQRFPALRDLKAQQPRRLDRHADRFTVPSQHHLTVVANVDPVVGELLAQFLVLQWAALRMALVLDHVVAGAEAQALQGGAHGRGTRRSRPRPITCSVGTPIRTPVSRPGFPRWILHAFVVNVTMIATRHWVHKSSDQRLISGPSGGDQDRGGHRETVSCGEARQRSEHRRIEGQLAIRGELLLEVREIVPEFTQSLRTLTPGAGDSTRLLTNVVEASGLQRSAKSARLDFMDERTNTSRSNVLGDKAPQRRTARHGRAERPNQVVTRPLVSLIAHRLRAGRCGMPAALTRNTLSIALAPPCAAYCVCADAVLGRQRFVQGQDTSQRTNASFRSVGVVVSSDGPATA